VPRIRQLQVSIRRNNLPSAQLRPSPLVLVGSKPYREYMRITTWAEYGVICALNLAKRTDLGPVNGREIARQERLPADYVEQILLRLRRAGVITSTRGARGGYVLARTPAEISIRDVIHASELETFDLHCVSHPVEEERCSASHSCSIRPVWVMLQNKIDDVLQGVSLADLLHDEPTVRERVGLSRAESGAPERAGLPSLETV
jgi:Rrf2 family protein